MKQAAAAAAAAAAARLPTAAIRRSAMGMNGAGYRVRFRADEIRHGPEVEKEDGLDSVAEREEEASLSSNGPHLSDVALEKLDGSEGVDLTGFGSDENSGDTTSASAFDPSQAPSNKSFARIPIVKKMLPKSVPATQQVYYAR